MVGTWYGRVHGDEVRRVKMLMEPLPMGTKMPFRMRSTAVVAFARLHGTSITKYMFCTDEKQISIKEFQTSRQFYVLKLNAVAFPVYSMRRFMQQTTEKER